MARGKQTAPKAPTAPWTAKATLAAVMLGLVGSMCGAAAGLLVPDGGLFADGRARQALRTDSARSLKEAIGLGEGQGDGDGVAALAHMLLWREHVGGDEHRVVAEKLLQRAGPARISNEGLYARALLVEAGGSDTTLDADLKGAKESALTLLARASRTSDAGDRLSLLERAATTSSPLPHATHRWARAAAAAGDLPLARAVLDRLFRLAPEHPGGRLTAVVVAALEEAKLPENRRRQTGEASADEVRLLAGNLNDDDNGLRAAFGIALAGARGVEVPAKLRAIVVDGSARSQGLARAALELALASGDSAFAQEIVKSQKTIERLDLLAAVSRARFLAELPEAEVRAATKEPRRIDGDGLVLPFGTLRFVVDKPGVPWAAALSPTVYPERRYQRLLAEVEAGGRRERLDQRLQAIEQLGLADRALARGETEAAAVHITTAQARAGVDPDVALTEAAVVSRRGDARGAQGAIDSAVASATLDAGMLLRAARLSLELDHLGGARRALSAFRKLGFRSAEAAALEANLEARSGDMLSARNAIAEAGRLGGSDDALTLRASILVHRLNDPPAARLAADRLLKTGAADGGGDIVSAWVADAARREGDAARAETTLAAITTTKPNIAEAWLFYAEAIAYNPTRAAEATAAATTASKRLAGPLLAEAKAFLFRSKSKKRR